MSAFETITKQLLKYRLKTKLYNLFTGILKCFIGILPVLLFVLLLDVWVAFPVSIRWLPAGLFIVYVLIIVMTTSLKPLYRLTIAFSKPDLVETAYIVGEKIDTVHDRLGNALNVYIHIERDKPHTSVQLAMASLESAVQQCSSLDLSNYVDKQTFIRMLKNAVGVVSVSILLSFLLAGPLVRSWNRMIHPAQDFRVQQSLTFSVQPGNSTIMSGDSLQIKMHSSDTTLKKADLIIEYENSTEHVTLRRDTEHLFTTTLENCRKSFFYFVNARGTKSSKFCITVLEHPIIRNLSIQVIPPAYTGLSVRAIEENIGNITALAGAHVRLEAKASKSLKQADLMFTDSSRFSLSVQDEQLYGTFRVKKDDCYKIMLLDQDSLCNPNPISYEIRVLKDQYPFTEIISPGHDIELGDDMRIPLVIEAQDDYGISRMQLGYQILEEGKGAVDSTGFSFKLMPGVSGQKRVEYEYDWDVNGTNMLPTDVLVYFARVYDNDIVKGPKYASTRLYRARFPSLAEMYDSFTQNHTRTAEQLQESFNKSMELQQRIEKLSRELKRDQKLDWQKKKEIEETFKQQQSIQKNLDEIRNNLENMIQQSHKDQLLSPETLEKYEQIQQLYKEIETPELEEMMKKMGKNFDQINRQQMQEAIEKLRQQEQDVNKALDRTISLLKRLKTEQKLDQAAKMARDLAERQEKIANDSSQNSDRVQREQQRINKDTEKLKSLLHELKELIKEEPEPPKAMLNNALSGLEDDLFKQAMSDLENLSNTALGEMQSAVSNVSNSFKKAASDIETAKQMMNGELMRKLLQALQKNARQLLDLSAEQENLTENTRTLTENSSYYPQIAERQEQMRSALDRVTKSILESSHESMKITKGIIESLGEADHAMQQALKEMEQRNSFPAAESEERAMMALNSAVLNISGILQNMMQQGGQGGMSMQTFMQQMQKMADAQQQINQKTPQLSSTGQLSMQQQAAMSRLAAQQRNLKEAMQMLSEEMSDNQEILGSLEKIAEDMERVEKDLIENAIDRETIQRQNRILSRMLDSQKSVREREYSRKRQAETGTHYTSESPADLSNSIYDKNKIKQYLLRARQEGYTRDYLELIEQYYEALSNKDND